MQIKVTDITNGCTSNDYLFMGDADEFLEINGYDEEIELKLNELERKRDGESIVIIGKFTEIFLVEKDTFYIYD